jgi:hypothetical protein
MPEAAQIACLGQNGQSVRWPDARHGHETPAIGIIPQHDGSLFGDMLAEPKQIQILSKDEAEHRYGGAVERHWYSDRPLGGGVNLCEQRPLAHFAADQVPGPRLELPFAQGSNRGWRRKAGQQLYQPNAMVRTNEAINLREVEREVMVAQRVSHTHASQRYLKNASLKVPGHR